MGQVPYGIVGDGRMARHFARYLELLDIPFVRWSRRSGRPLSDLAPCATICLLISDSAIEGFAREHREGALAGKRLVHFSGSLSTTEAAGMHPLMTFGRELYALEAYRAIAFVTERGRDGFTDVFPGLPNPAYAISPEERPFYHALCVLGGNFPQILARKMLTGLQRSLGIPREAALPYLRQAFANFVADPEGALTGPHARGDAATIRANSAALARAGDPFAPVYDAVTASFAAVERNAR